jgi:hypothetical protein
MPREKGESLRADFNGGKVLGTFHHQAGQSGVELRIQAPEGAEATIPNPLELGDADLHAFAFQPLTELADAVRFGVD